MADIRSYQARVWEDVTLEYEDRDAAIQIILGSLSFILLLD